MRARPVMMAAAALLLGLFSAMASAQPRQTPVPAAGPDSCPWAFNDICDEAERGGTGQCAAATDRTDCTSRRRGTTPYGSFFGYDDRIVFNTSEYPWSAIGQLYFDNGAACSGVLISEDVVLTAAHCILHYGNVVAGGEFLTARGRASGPFEAEIIDSHVLTTMRDDPAMERLFRENVDWALLKLSAPVGREAGFIAVEAVSDNRPLRRDLISFIAMVVITYLAAFALKGRQRLVLQGLAAVGMIVLVIFALRTFWGEDPRLERVWQAGYSGDTGDNLTGSTDCRVLEFRASGLIGHDCDTVVGDSGSPLLVRRGEDWAIIAIVSHSRFTRSDSAPSGLVDRSYAVSTSVVPDPAAVFGTSGDQR